MAEKESSNRPAEYLFTQSTLDAVTRPKIMFQRVQKRDGTIVDFNKSKIAHAIFASAQSVGGKDRDMAENLADRVILYLARNYEDGLLNVEQIQDAVEKVLIENGHARTSKAFILYREQRARIRRLKSGQKPLIQDVSLSYKPSPVSADLQVHTSDDELVSWNREKIVEALIREAGIDKEIAQLIASEVEIQIVYSKMQVVTVGLIRELVNAKLIEYGLIQEHRMHARLGLPVYDIEQLFFWNAAGEQSNSRDPLTADSIISREIYRQYALTRVFSNGVVNAHTRGQIHIHDLDAITRFVRGPVPVEYVLKNGLHFPHRDSYIKPAENFPELISQLIQLGVIWQNYFVESVGWYDFNVLLSPSIRTIDRVELDREIHHFLDELNGLGNGTNHQFHFTISKESSIESIDIVTSFLSSYIRGDDVGRDYMNILPIIHISEGFLQSENYSSVVRQISELIHEKRNIRFFFERKWKPEYTHILQKVTLNIVEAAGRARQNLDEFCRLIQEQIQSAIQAHSMKNRLVDHLLSSGKNGLLSFWVEAIGESIQAKSRVSRFTIGLTGLEQTVDLLSPSPNFGFEKRIELAVQILDRLRALVQQEGWKSGLDCIIEPTLDKQITQRLSKLAQIPVMTPFWTPGVGFNNKPDIPAIELMKYIGQIHSVLNTLSIHYISPDKMDMKPEHLDRWISEILQKTQTNFIAVQK